jgi:tripartite-type tricarboxylate transporter receptor subunit TctC
VLTTRQAMCLVALALAVVHAPAHAQTYPQHPIRFMIGFAPGGSSDLVSRLVGQKLSERLGQPVVMEQKQGASGVIAQDVVAKAPPDGHTMVLLTGGHPVSAATMKLPYDPVRGFAMVSIVTSYPFAISVAPSSPMNSMADLIARGKAGQPLTFAMSGPGSVHNLLGELVNLEAGIAMTGVSYRGAAQALIDLTTGRVDVMVETATFSFEKIRNGDMKALALSSGGRYPLMPDVPVIAETLPNVEVTSWLGLATAPGTPASIVDRLNREVREIVALPDVRQRLADFGGVPTPTTPDEMRTRIEREIARWTRVVTLKHIEVQ